MSDSSAPTRTAEPLASTVANYRIRLAGEGALAAFWAAVFLVALNFAVTLAFYLVSGVWSWSLFSPDAGAYPTDAVSRLANSGDVRFMQGDPGFFVRIVVASFVCVLPVIARALRAGTRYLLDETLFSFSSDGLPRLFNRWAGVVLGIFVAATLAGL